MIFTVPTRPTVHSGSSSGSAETAAREARSRVESLEAELERVLILAEAMWTLMQRRLGCQDEELMRTIAEIDMRDGKLDGKVSATPPQPCPSCGRTLTKKRPLCLFCGTAVLQDPFAR
jgi:hypothetical protein